MLFLQQREQDSTKSKTSGPGKVQHSLSDTLMAGFAMFSLKDPSLLAFDERRFAEPHNLKTIYGMRKCQVIYAQALSIAFQAKRPSKSERGKCMI